MKGKAGDDTTQGTYYTYCGRCAEERRKVRQRLRPS